MYESVRKMCTVLAMGSHSISARRRGMNRKIKDLLDGLGFGAIIFIIMAVDAQEPIYLHVALGLVLLALGAVIAERIIR